MRLLPRSGWTIVTLALLVVAALVAVGAVVVVPLLRTGDAYVALGDSYTAAPGVPNGDGSDGCRRSNHNYPHLLAAAEGLDLTDVSCTGATTGNLTQPQDTSEGQVAAQLDALDGLDPRLVTIGIGGNDFDLSSILLNYCGKQGAADPDGTPCTDQDAGLERPIAELITEMGEHVREALEEVVARAPDAQVLAIGYPQVFPATGTCRDLLPHATGDYPWARSLNEQLNQAVHDAADAAGVGFVDVWSLSEGHDVCSTDPWINGAVDKPGQAQAYHPFAAYEAAVADLIAQRL